VTGFSYAIGASLSLWTRETFSRTGRLRLPKTPVLKILGTNQDISPYGTATSKSDGSGTMAVIWKPAKILGPKRFGIFRLLECQTKVVLL
jgi:hypothetical protein